MKNNLKTDSDLFFQKRNGEYLPNECQPKNGAEKRYVKHSSTRYINLTIGENGKAVQKLNGKEVVSQRNVPELYINREECCGCGACFNICPMSGSERPKNAVRTENGKYIEYDNGLETSRYEHTGAITMLPDEEGFFYPVVDAELCIRCCKCVNVCAFKKDLK